MMSLEFALKSAAAGQVVIAVLGSCIPRLLDWREDVARMPLLVREVFFIHMWFVSFTLGIFAVLTWRFAPVLAAGGNELGRWFAGALAVFWGVRCVMQWAHYSSSHWRGNPGRTAIHWALFLGYGAWAVAYAAAAGH